MSRRLKQSVNMYASIKNMTFSQEHPKSSFLAKCLSSLRNNCSMYPGPLSILMQKGPFKGWLLSSCDHRFLVRFLF